MHDKYLSEAKKKEKAQEELEDLGIGSTMENTGKNRKKKNVGNHEWENGTENLC